MPYKKDDIERRVVEASTASRDVQNKIEVLPVSFFDDELRFRIARAIYGNPAFWHYAAMANPPIHIVVENGHVTLTGVVNSNVERALARSLATGFGAFSVNNELKTDAEMKHGAGKDLTLEPEATSAGRGRGFHASQRMHGSTEHSAKIHAKCDIREVEALSVRLRFCVASVLRLFPPSAPLRPSASPRNDRRRAARTRRRPRGRRSCSVRARIDSVSMRTSTSERLALQAIAQRLLPREDVAALDFARRGVVILDACSGCACAPRRSPSPSQAGDRDGARRPGPPRFCRRRESATPLARTDRSTTRTAPPAPACGCRRSRAAPGRSAGRRAATGG